MRKAHVAYDQIAATYDQRYAANPLHAVAAALRSLAQRPAARILEVGCGTGRWLAELEADGRRVQGLDLSLAMLKQARARAGQAGLACGDACHPPFPEAAFDLILCVNALHHFAQPEIFVAEARRLLRPEGALVVIGMDPHAGRDRWYLYDYFEGMLEADRARYPSAGALLDWMTGAGFDHVEWHVVEHIRRQFTGQEVLGDPFLAKNSTSQLVLLTDEAYAAGLARMRAALAAAAAQGRALVFPVDISLMMIAGALGPG